MRGRSDVTKWPAAKKSADCCKSDSASSSEHQQGSGVSRREAATAEHGPILKLLGIRDRNQELTQFESRHTEAL